MRLTAVGLQLAVCAQTHRRKHPTGWSWRTLRLASTAALIPSLCLPTVRRPHTRKERKKQAICVVFRARTVREEKPRSRNRTLLEGRLVLEWDELDVFCTNYSVLSMDFNTVELPWELKYCWVLLVNIVLSHEALCFTWRGRRWSSQCCMSFCLFWVSFTWFITAISWVWDTLVP